MNIAIAELAKAREVAIELLDELDLTGYLFEIETSSNSQWGLRLEFQVDDNGTWEAITLPVLKETLLSNQTEKVARQRLLNQWQDILKAHSSAN